MTAATLNEIPKAYNPAAAEAEHYARWEAAGCFAPEINQNPDAPVYSIAIPPPNITGSLHMGHALQHTIMDVLTRWKRMLGYRTLWLPGTDHAGISAQRVVKNLLWEKEKKTPHDLGREAFVERVWAWKRQSGGQITTQMRREGASVDWSREQFTMDERLNGVVREVFVRLYEQGYIYRGPRIINWCPNDQTVISDLEVGKTPVGKDTGRLWHLQYPIEGSERRITVATTRPETMLGDTAVAVNPADPRYTELIGATLELPLTGRTIPVISDSYVDAAFGSGAVKITPAHDPNDYEIGLRHNLPHVVVIGKDAKMTDAAGAEFAGLDRYEARNLVVKKFDELGLLEKVEEYELNISTCERCKTVIEPLVMTQWFCRMDEMRGFALDLLQNQQLPRFTPASYEKVYRDWLENLRDWTISRQLWWGHQIPAWYAADGQMYVARTRAEAAQIAGTDDLTQDSDVLDTWFSSALWPFSTLGWPEQTEDLATFYPTSVLVTARDIIFLWVSRMVMTGAKFVGATPFYEVFITGTVFGRDGKPMSKSRNNGVDPLEVFDKFGVDATRLFLAAIGSSDMRWSDSQIEANRNFANKIWNAARFCLMNSEGVAESVLESMREVTGEAPQKYEAKYATNLIAWGWVGLGNALPLADRWIAARICQAAEKVEQALESYDFHTAVQTLYHFFWDDFCDWYIELVKADVTAPEATPERAAARSRLLSMLEMALRLLHPFMPYLTEELWLRLPLIGKHSLHKNYRGAEPTIMLAAYPRRSFKQEFDARAEREMQAVIEVISKVRSIRAEMNIKPSERVPVLIGCANDALRDALHANQAQIVKLARAASVAIARQLTAPQASARAVTSAAEIAVPLEGLIDFAQERARLNKERDKLQKELDKINAQLSNPNFVQRAPQEKVDELRARVADIAQRMNTLAQNLEALQ